MSSPLRTSLAATAVLLFVVIVSARPANRGVPLGPCTTGAATHYNDSYMWDPSKGGTCGLNPIKYTRLGGAFAASRAIYYPRVDGSADGCGVCYEVYAANGARNIIVADINYGGSADERMDLNLIKSGKSGSVWEDITNYAGMGNVGVTYRKVTCPQLADDESNAWVEGNIKAQWQKSGANNFYWEMHFWNHRVEIMNMTITSSINTLPVTVPRKSGAQNAFVWQESGNVGVPFTMTIYSAYGQTLTKVIGSEGQDVATLAGSGNVFDFGGQFGIPSSNPYADDDDCKPPTLPTVIYDDEYQSQKKLDSQPDIWMQITTWRATVNVGYTSNCYEGSKCIQVVYQQDGALVIGTVFQFMKSDFTGVRFYARGDTAESGLSIKVSSQSPGLSFNVSSSWKQVTLNFADYPDIPELVKPAYFYFSGSQATVYLDKIELFGGDGWAHYFPTAKVFTSENPNSGASSLLPPGPYLSSIL